MNLDRELKEDLQLCSRSECPVCGEERSEVPYRFDGIALRRCVACRMAWTDPFLTEEGMQQFFSEALFERYPFLKGYDAVGSAPDQGRHTIQGFARALEHLEKSGAYPGPLLDIGCGSGVFLKLAKQRGWKVQGVDFDAKRVETLNRDFGIPVELGGWKRPSAQDGAFSVVCMWDVLEHLESPCAVIHECGRILKPGGRVLIACPNDRSLVMLIAFFLRRITFGAFEKPLRYMYTLLHPLYFRPSVVRTLLKQEGLEVERLNLDHTDLDRLNLPLYVRWAAKVIFWIASWSGLGNRFVVIARKV